MRNTAIGRIYAYSLADAIFLRGFKLIALRVLAYFKESIVYFKKINTIVLDSSFRWYFFHNLV